LCESAEKTKEILRTGEPIILSLAKLPVLVSTSLDPKTWYDAADCLGISGHVVKPLSAQELLECVGFVLDSVGSELLSRIRAMSRSREQKILRGATEVMKQERFKSSAKAGKLSPADGAGHDLETVGIPGVEAASKRSRDDSRV
jgi:hypothetical protein